MVAGLERSGYLERTTHPQDRRRRAVRLTDSGRRCLTELNDAEAIDALVPHGLSGTQTAQLRQLLIRFLDSP